ncbi:hypothetical protein [Notoacmeibacter ruber]|uniref:Holin n=1 Tax=Notoacmeibacter ruber TaxID=2670375 RepID=A0A3L7JD77_9HYPH|nr:hypothetical protein [Notoacmeibacter ruber]RLQ87531.1 hypothetical protein D8780_04225 [Notoacmeibacter ruber]
MTDQKPWFLSKTIWASLCTVILAAASFAGIPTGGLEGGALADGILQILTALSGLVALWGRVTASRVIG